MDNGSVAPQRWIVLAGILLIACSLASCGSHPGVATSDARSACATENPVTPLGPAPGTTFERVLTSYQYAYLDATSAAAHDHKWSPMAKAIAVEIKLWSQVVRAFGPDASHSLELDESNPGALLVNREVVQLDMERPIATLTALCDQADS